MAIFIIIQMILNFWGKTLSDAVLIAILTTTTANVLGIFYIVTHWLYPSERNQTQKK